MPHFNIQIWFVWVWFWWSSLKGHYSYLFYMQKWCKACVLLDGLNRGLPKLGIGRSRGGVGSENGNESKVHKSIQGKQCGTLDFWFESTAFVYLCLIKRRCSNHLSTIQWQLLTVELCISTWWPPNYMTSNRWKRKSPFDNRNWLNNTYKKEWGQINLKGSLLVAFFVYTNSVREAREGEWRGNMESVPYKYLMIIDIPNGSDLLFVSFRLFHIT